MSNLENGSSKKINEFFYKDDGGIFSKIKNIV